MLRPNLTIQGLNHGLSGFKDFADFFGCDKNIIDWRIKNLCNPIIRQIRDSDFFLASMPHIARSQLIDRIVFIGNAIAKPHETFYHEVVKI